MITRWQAAALVLVIGISASRIAGQVSRSAPAELREIQALVKQGKLAEAERRLNEALHESPREAPLYDLRGVVNAQRGNYHDAEWDFLKATELDPLLAGAYLNLGHLYQQNAASDRKALDKALDVYKEVLKIDPASTEANYQSAVLLEHRKAYQLSLDRLARLAAQDQEKAQSLSVRCADLAGLGRRTESSITADRLLASQGALEANIDLILPRLEANHWSDLEQHLPEGAAQRGIASPRLLERLGSIYAQEGRLDAARATLERAAGSGVPPAEMLLESARITDKQQDYKATLGYPAQARDLDAKNPAIHFFFGIVAVKENLLEEAYRSLKQAAALAPENAYFNYALGAVAEERADPGEALSCFKKYCALRPRDPQGRLQLGITYFKMHRRTLLKRSWPARCSTTIPLLRPISIWRVSPTRGVITRKHSRAAPSPRHPARICRCLRRGGHHPYEAKKLSSRGRGSEPCTAH